MSFSQELQKSQPDLYDRKDDALIQVLIEEVKEMRRELKEHQESEKEELKEIKQAFDTAKSVVWFIKWSVTVVTALALSWAFLKDHFTIGIK